MAIRLRSLFRQREREHRIPGPDADSASDEFRYYFCRREAVESLIYIKEVCHADRVSQLLHNFGHRLAVDKPHRIKMQPAFQTNIKNFNDIRVIEGGDGQRFVLESFNSVLIYSCREGKHF